MSLNINILLFIGIVVLCFALGAVVVWGIDRVKMSELKSERDEAILARVTMQKQWEEAVNELNKTKVFLNDTLAALELLRKYQLIDNDTKEDINKLKNSLGPQGEVTQDTKDVFKKLVDEFNKLNGNLGTSIMNWEPIDITPFKELRQEAERLYNTTQEIFIEIGVKP